MVPSGQKAPTDSVLLRKTNFSVANVGVSYMGSEKHIELIGEYFNVSNNMTGKIKNTQGYFLYLGYHIKKFLCKLLACERSFCIIQIYSQHRFILFETLKLQPFIYLYLLRDVTFFAFNCFDCL